MGRAHLVEGSDPVADMELGNVFADCVDVAGDVVTRVGGFVSLILLSYGGYDRVLWRTISWYRTHIGGTKEQLAFQSLGLVPTTTLRITTCLGPGWGIGASWIVVCSALDSSTETKTSFMLPVVV